MIGQVFYDCQIKEKIAVASTGTVYHAHDKKLHVSRAIKILHPALASKEVVRNRFYQALQNWACLDHPNFVHLFAAIDEGDKLGFITNYIEGNTLAKLIATRGQLGVSQSIEYFFQIVRALSFAHKQQVLHRKLSTSNIIVNRDETIKIMGLGALRAVDVKGITPANVCIGKANYMAPEQFAGNYTPLSDQYSLGVIFYEMLTGKTPFAGETITSIFKMHAHQKPVPPTEYNQDISPEMEKLILKMLAKNPEKRFDNLNVLTEELATITDRLDYSSDLSISSLMSHGKKALERRKFDHAICFFHKVLFLYDNEEHLLHEAEKKRRKALELKEEEEDALKGRVWLQDALAHFDEEETEKAKKVIRNILILVKRKHPDSSRLLGVYQDLKREMEDLVVEMEKQLAEEQEQTDHLIKLAHEALDKDELEDAEFFLKDTLHIFPDHRQALKMWRHIEKIKKIKEISKLYGQAMQEFYQKNYPKSLEYFEAVLQREPEHAQALENRQKAQEAYQEYLQQEQEIDQQYQRGLALYEKWQYPQAIEKFQTVLEQREDYKKAQHFMHEAQNRLTDNNKVEDISFFYHQGIYFYKERHWREAIACFNSVLKEMDHHRMALEYKAKAEEELAKEQGSSKMSKS